MLYPPFFDPEKSFEDNATQGPFNGFADGNVLIQEGEPSYDFFGCKVFEPFGIPVAVTYC